MQKITIKKLGPITSFTTEINQYLFLIGEQATGKSTIAKCIYFCRNYKSVLREAFYDVYNTGMYKGEVIERADQFMQLLRSEVKNQFIEFFGYSWDFDRSMHLQYVFVPDKVWLNISLENKKGYIHLSHSKYLSSRINELLGEVINLYRNKYITKDAIGLNSKERIRTQAIIRDKINAIFEDYEETYYIPAGRSLLALLSRGDITSMRPSLDYVTRQFVDIINSIRRYFVNGIAETGGMMPFKTIETYHKISSLIVDILKADYYNAPEKEYIKIKRKNGKDFSINLNFASSGQQESLWLLNLIYVLFLREERSFVIIEEPEAHIYPLRQYKLLKFITYFANETKSNILITTHSPYCLTALNTLYAGGASLLERYPQMKEKVHNILGGNYAVPEGKLNAYQVSTSGVETLLEGLDRELSTEKIDEVSDEIIGDYLKINEILSEILE